MTLFDKINEMNISDKSKQIYKMQLKKLNNDVEPENNKYLMNTKKIQEKLDKMSVASQINYIRSIMLVLDPKTKAYKHYYELKGDLSSKNIDDKSQNQKERSYNEGEIKDIQAKLVHDLLMHLPRRAMDLYELKYYDGGDMNKNYNYLGKENGEYVLIFNNYKTANLYGTQKFKFPKEVIPQLEKWLEQPETQNAEFVFGRKKDGTIKQFEGVNGFSQWFNRATGRTFNDMRHLYAQKNVKGISEELDEHLNKLGHSYKTSKYYIKT